MKREGRSILQDVGTFSMLKVWLGLEVRHLMNLSVKQVCQNLQTNFTLQFDKY